MISPKHQVTDDFWDVKAQEGQVRERYQSQIDHLERVINLGKRALQIRNQPGFQDFLEALKSLHQAEQTKLVGCFSGNDHMRIIQGKAQALSDVLALLETDKNIQGLEARLDAVKNELAIISTADGKVITDPLGANA